MANKSLFKSLRGRLAPKAETRNEAGGLAYGLEPTHALAQCAATGCLSGVFYADAETQVSKVLGICDQVAPGFIAKAAIYSRTQGFMKDMPALLCAVLAHKAPEHLESTFARVIDSPKMLRNFVQIIRSGIVGRKSLGTLPKRLVQRWLEQRTDEQLFAGSVGNDPSLADIIKMVHPKPLTAERNAVYGYLTGRPFSGKQLPPLIREFETFKRSRGTSRGTVPNVPFQLLTALDLSRSEWTDIARNASWQTTRMNLNTFLRHGVLNDAAMVELVAARLRDPSLIAQAKVFPYQLMNAYLNVAANMPSPIREALQDAMELAIAAVPKIEGKVFVFPDISGSMQSPVTGHRQGSTSKVRCVDVAALVASAILRINPSAEVVPFESQAIPPEKVGLNPRDSVMTNASKLAALPCGGTNCSAPLAYLNERRATGDLIVYVSDNESWMDSPHYGRFGGGATQTMQEWEAFKQRSPSARMICIDIQPYSTTQAKERDDILNVGGFSDEVFRLIAAVAEGRTSAGYWSRVIDAIPIQN